MDSIPQIVLASLFATATVTTIEYFRPPDLRRPESRLLRRSDCCCNHDFNEDVLSQVGDADCSSDWQILFCQP